MKPKITIFSVPFYYSKTPQLAPPLLKAYLNENNIDCTYVDLSIKFNVYLQNNFDILNKKIETSLNGFLEGNFWREEKQLNKQDLKQFYYSLKKISLFSYQFLEEKLGENIIFADKNIRKTNQSHIEEVIRLNYFVNLNHNLFCENSLTICEAPNELRSRIKSGIYNDFFQSESVFPFLEHAVKSDVVAISANYEAQLLATLVLAYELKKINPDIYIIIGGSNISRSAIDPRFSKELLKNGYGINAIGLYEGELTLKELAFCINKHQDLKLVPNLLFYDKISDQIIATRIIPSPHPDDLPTPEYNHDELELYWKIANDTFDYSRLNILVSRGCYWGKCSFCVDRYTFNPTNPAYQTRSIDKIIKDIEILQSKHRASYFNLITSAMPPKLAKDFSKAVFEKGISAKFWTYFRCGNEKIMDQEFFYLLKKAGFDTVVLGAESLDDRVLTKCNKGTSQEDNIYTLCGFAKAGIKIKLNIIYDLPPVSLDGFYKSIQIIRKYADFIYDLDMFPFLLFSHSDIGKNPKDFGIEVKPGPNNLIPNSGPPDFIIKEYQNPLYNEISRDEAAQIAAKTKKELDFYIWTKDLRNKIASMSFSWDESLFIMKPFFAIKYPISYRYQGKKLNVFYVFLEGYMGWFEIQENFDELINLLCKAVQEATIASNFFEAFVKGWRKNGENCEQDEIKNKFINFMLELVFNGFVKDIINKANLENQASNVNFINYSREVNSVAEFYEPVFIPNIGNAI